MARLLSVNVGLPRDIEWQGKTVHTAVWKTPVQGRRMVRRLNVDGDGQGRFGRGMAANTGQSLSTRSNLIVIGKPARSKRIYLWPVRREFHHRRTGGY